MCVDRPERATHSKRNDVCICNGRALSQAIITQRCTSPNAHCTCGYGLDCSTRWWVLDFLGRLWSLTLPKVNFGNALHNNRYIIVAEFGQVGNHFRGLKLDLRVHMPD